MLVKRELLVSERFVSGEWKRGGSRNGYSFQNPEKKKKNLLYFFFDLLLFSGTFRHRRSWKKSYFFLTNREGLLPSSDFLQKSAKKNKTKWGKEARMDGRKEQRCQGKEEDAKSPKIQKIQTWNSYEAKWLNDFRNLMHARKFTAALLLRNLS